MEKSVSTFVAGFLVGVLLATAGFAWYVRGIGPDASGGPAVRVLKLGHSLDPSHPVHLAMVHMNERLQEISGGAMKLEIYASGVLGSETECLEQLQNGVLAMTKASTSPMEAFVPEMQVFGMPYLFRDSDHFWTILRGEVGTKLLRRGREKNLLGLCYYDAGSRNFYTVKRPVRSPADLDGLKIRVQKSPMAMEMVKALGGAPTPIDWGELYSSLAQGAVDGAENNLPSFFSNKHYEVARFFTLNAHTYVPDMLIINTPTWDSLSLREQEWLQRAADESCAYQRKLWKEATAKNLKEAPEKGVQIIEPDLEAFREKVAPMYDAYADSVIGGLIEKIKAAK